MGMYAEQPVTVETDSMRRIDLEEVMIHATKTGALLKDLPNRVEVVTKRQIEASGINNLTDRFIKFSNVWMFFEQFIYFFVQSSPVE
jgi:hypothetical protein